MPHGSGRVGSGDLIPLKVLEQKNDHCGTSHTQQPVLLG